jgi:hypothetical protein
VRSDLDLAHGVDMTDGAAAGPDLDEIDDGNAQRQATAFLETIGPVDFEPGIVLGHEIVDDAHFGSGAAHVEGQKLVDAERVRDRHGKRRAAGRTAFDQPDRRLARRLDRSQSAFRHHDQYRRMDTHFTQALLHSYEIIDDNRPHIGVGACRRRALIFPGERRDIA